MITRVLPHEEWSRLDGTEAEQVWRALDPERTTVLVVEDDGKIVGTWTLLWVLHAECVWVDPAHRKRGSVARRLWLAMKAAAERFGALGVMTAAGSPEVDALLVDRADELPGRHYVIPVAGMDARAKRVGEQFHEALEAVLGVPSHPDDPAHNLAVGRALVQGIDRQQPEAAMRAYNVWATKAGYAPIQYLGRDEQGRVVVDIVSAIVAIDQECRVSVQEQRPLVGQES